MIELAVVLSRLVQYIGAAVLFGSPLFCLYGLASGGLAGTWQRRLALFGGVIVVVGSALALLAACVNQGCWLEEWFSTRSMMTLMPRACAAARNASNSAMVP